MAGLVGLFALLVIGAFAWPKRSTPGHKKLLVAEIKRLVFDARLTRQREAAKKEKVAFQQASHSMSRSKSLTFVGRLNCSSVDVLNRMKSFLGTAPNGPEYTGCPNENMFLEVMHALSPTVADKVFVNIGAWKGYEVLRWLELWAPHYMLAKKLTRQLV